jgi:multiple RNA-binding domain-containing protein 1
VVTDLQLKHTKDGKFRGFAFVGYRTEEEAAAARQYFHGTYIGAAKIDVQTCADLGDQDKRKEIGVNRFVKF